MQQPRLIAIDMDGTLIGSNGQVSQRNLDALFAAEHAGIEVVIATGRRHTYAMKVLRALGLNEEHGVVSSNGTVIRTLGHDLVHRHHMPNETARWICEHISEFRNTLVLTFDTVQSDGEDVRGALVVEHLDDLHSSIGRWMQVNEPYIQQVQTLEAALEGDAPIQMMVCGTLARMEEAEAKLLEHPRVAPVDRAESMAGVDVTLHRTIYPERDLCILDILPAGVSKASALARLVEIRGFSMSDVLAIGDNWNDVPMLEQAGQAVVMANGPADLKELARERGWTLGPSNDEDGVAVAIEGVLAGAEEPVSA
jgi:hydroxymethylpyrimidine pyrophosphatase-like HAD family hydrolase